MPMLEEGVLCRAPAVQVWKLLHDPGRFVEWWAGVGRAEPMNGGAMLYPDAWPGLAVPTRVSAGAEDRRMVLNCLLTDDVYTWMLEPHPQGCRVVVRVELPEGEESRLGTRRAEVLASLPRLAAAAERAARPVMANDTRPGGR